MNLSIVGQGSTVLAVGAVVWTLFLSSIISLFYLPLSGGMVGWSEGAG